MIVMKKIGFIVLMVALLCIAVAGEGIWAGLSAVAFSGLSARTIMKLGYGTERQI